MLTIAESREQLPTLNEAQQLKLKQLTLVTLAMGSRRLPYAELRTRLDVASDRDLCVALAAALTDAART